MSRSKLAYNVLMRLWPLGKIGHRLSALPLVGPLLQPVLTSTDDEAIIVPVHEAVRGAESVVLPYPLLTPLLERASARFIMNECLCRRGENCHAYPHEVGCIFLGDGAAEINPALGRLADVDQSLAHAQQAMEIGLTPLIVHAAFDAWIVDIPFRQMLAICFCCDCCCSIRQGLRLGPPAFWDTVIRLPGLTVEVGEKCTGCETCLDVCHVHAISIHEGQAHIGEPCKGCGRCAAVCPAGAITLRVAEEADVLGNLLARIGRRTDIGETAQ